MNSLSLKINSIGTLLTLLVLTLGLNANSISEAAADTSITRTKTTRTSTRSVSRKKTTRGNARVTSSSRVSTRARVSRGYGHDTGYRSSHGRRAVVRHRPIHPRTRTSSRSGFLPDVLFEVGGTLFTPVEGDTYTGLQLAVGSRVGPLAGLVEAQVEQGSEGARFRDLNAQLRLYLPVSYLVEIFPVLAYGQSDLLTRQSASHLDLGLGAQINLSSHFSVGGRYSARLVADQVEGVPTNGHNLLAHLSFKF